MASSDATGSLTPSFDAVSAWAEAAIAQMTAKRASARNATPKVSILVPIYNAERYLEACLDSLVVQTLGAIEIICINDGSTDSSASILARYAAWDKRIRVITKPNTGYGDSMNRGILAATGEYIGICEPDDYADPRMFEMLYGTAVRLRADIAKSNYYRHTDTEDTLFAVLEGFPVGTCISARTNPQILLMEPSIWTCVYRRQMILDNGICFTNSPGASFQDASFAQQCLLSAQSIVLLRGAYLHYRMDNPDSSSKSSEKVYAVCEECDRTVDFLRKRSADDLAFFGPWLYAMRNGQYVWNYNRIDQAHRPAFIQRWLSDIEKAQAEGLYDEAVMTPGYRALMSELREGAEAFCTRYPGDIEYPPLR